MTKNAACTVDGQCGLHRRRLMWAPPLKVNLGNRSMCGARDLRRRRRMANDKGAKMVTNDRESFIISCLSPTYTYPFNLKSLYIDGVSDRCGQCVEEKNHLATFYSFNSIDTSLNCYGEISEVITVSKLKTFEAWTHMRWRFPENPLSDPHPMQIALPFERDVIGCYKVATHLFRTCLSDLRKLSFPELDLQLTSGGERSPNNIAKEAPHLHVLKGKLDLQHKWNKDHDAESGIAEWDASYGEDRDDSKGQLGMIGIPRGTCTDNPRVFGLNIGCEGPQPSYYGRWGDELANDLQDFAQSIPVLVASVGNGHPRVWQLVGWRVFGGFLLKYWAVWDVGSTGRKVLARAIRLQLVSARAE
ncbi:hypothetical protein C8F01DRAFT_1226617 [Mycena amicta]|nr:hypothetical protein C8F01DRAFT_1226617 [Mycena amicta]